MWPLELVDLDRKQNGPTLIQEGEVTDLLTRLHAHECMGLDGICPRVMRELVEELTKMLSVF